MRQSIHFYLFDPQRTRKRLGTTIDNPMSVFDLTIQTREIVESRLRGVWVRGELSDFKRHRNGHWYFCLRDRDAQIRCVVWLADQYRIPAAPDDGMQVVVFGHMTVFAARGDLQLKVVRIDAQGDGLWRKAMELTLAKLRKEGLLDDSRKRPIPQYPRCIAVVTSADGAALRDIAAVIRKRNLGARLVVCPAQVQGETAALEIAAAIRRVGRWAKADVLIVGRGGGSKDDLWAFNDEHVARAVAASAVPVISAVGHEVDLTVCDAVADLRAPTPSAAANAACLSREEVTKAFVSARRHLSDLISSRLRTLRRDVERFGSLMSDSAEQIVSERRSFLANAAARLNALSPLATLSRGYAVARDESGAALISARQFSTGLKFELLLHDGQIGAKTEEVKRSSA